MVHPCYIGGENAVHVRKNARKEEGNRRGFCGKMCRSRRRRAFSAIKTRPEGVVEIAADLLSQKKRKIGNDAGFDQAHDISTPPTCRHKPGVTCVAPFPRAADR